MKHNAQVEGLYMPVYLDHKEDVNSSCYVQSTE